MSACTCDRITDSGQPMCPRCTALVTFGLSAGATQPEIKDAYRLLAKVWHPDRFEGDEHLKLKAEEKLKEINSAYQLLTTTADERGYASSSRPASRPDANQRSTATGPKGQQDHRPGTSNFSRPYRRNERASKRPLAIAVVVLVAAGGIWIAQRYVRPTMWDVGARITSDSAARQADSTDKASAEAATKGAILSGTVDQTSKQKPAANESAGLSEKAEAHPRTNVAPSRASVVVYPSEDPLVPYFTVGSTKDDVIRVQGAPKKRTDRVFTYGLSEVYFRNGRVEAWRIDPGSPLRARAPQD
jgi:curved DNA-binding protein CbpA